MSSTNTNTNTSSAGGSSSTPSQSTTTTSTTSTSTTPTAGDIALTNFLRDPATQRDIGRFLHGLPTQNTQNTQQSRGSDEGYSST
jgi:hypothetical protein